MANTYTTDNNAVTNNFELASKCLAILDKVYKAESKTSILDVSDERVSFNGTKKVSVYKTTMDGLANYNRNKGFVTGNSSGEWETLELTQDRGRSFLVDSMDNEESLGMAFGTLAGEFIRRFVTPEIDAYRFAKYASLEGATKATAANITASTDVAKLIDEADYVLGDMEIPQENRVLFVSEACYKQLKDGIAREVFNGETAINKGVLSYDGMRVIRVPSARFNTAITLKDGITDGQDEGGFAPTKGGYPINFMIVHPGSTIQIAKHVAPRIFRPEVNQNADGWLFQYRIYHDAFVLDEKAKGIYVHRAATANP